MYRFIEPEVSGGLGKQTVIEGEAHPPNITKLHYEFSGWLGDELLETFPCYIVSDNLKKAIEVSQLSGIYFDSVIITQSEEFYNSNEQKEMPNFYWARINGKLKSDDFFIAPDLRLAISETAFAVLKNFIKHAILEDYL